MKRTLYLDCFAGISGDMFIGALLSCGLDFELLKHELGKLAFDGYELTLDTVDRSGISAQKFDVVLQKHQHSHSHDHDHSHEHVHDHAHTHSHEHEHTHTHDHAHSHSHSHSPEHSHNHEPAHSHDDHRSLSEIKRMIEASSLSASVKVRAQRIFQRIGVAESKIHNIPIETVHFHEVGAVDSIIDIVGACIGLEALGIERVVSSPLHVGFGTFKCAHGTYPIPGPAATELLQGVPIYSKDIEGELVTPTGAALVAELAESFGHTPAMRIERSGYGAGTRTYEKFPNVLRVMIGTLESEVAVTPTLTTDAHATPTTITVIEANLDDMSPQVLGYVMDKALAAGALDLFYTPVHMKKNRPGVLLTLLCKPADRARLTKLLFSETTTLGIRYRDEARVILQRSFASVETPYGSIRLKLAKTADGQVVNVAPEFDDCRAAAELHQVALREVQAVAMKAYEKA
jgi:uncharacterized protein (TIGR00299 family) protein